ncbi:MAG: type II toxin-antitoxin system HicB family antitoxin [Chloroflexi bacterium]|nr:type II toxin-antitoxin system HicB family antitoxin [Chloroflexota bacterium]
MSKTLTSKYDVNIWWNEEDHIYVAEVPDLPGCMAHGRTRDAALAQVNDAMKLWLKTARELGREIPEPRTHLVAA